jgi:hypothetical protein
MKEAMASSGLKGVAAAAGAVARERGLPPVHLWNPDHCGEIDIVIRGDGRWFHEGAVIGRPALVRLFASVLRKDRDGFYLVTPVEKLRITVEDAPFLAVRVDRLVKIGTPCVLKFITNLGDEVVAGRDHPIRFATSPQTGDLRPYLRVRGALDALITRPVFYELVEMAEARRIAGLVQLCVNSDGAWFPLGPPLEAHEL